MTSAYYAQEIIDLADRLEALLQAEATETACLQTCDKEIMDILHWMESHSPDAATRAKVYKELERARIARREAKNSIFVLDKIVAQQRRIDIMHILRTAKMGAERAMETEKARMYSPRTDVIDRIEARAKGGDPKMDDKL